MNVGLKICCTVSADDAKALQVLGAATVDLTSTEIVRIRLDAMPVDAVGLYISFDSPTPPLLLKSLRLLDNNSRSVWIWDGSIEQLATGSDNGALLFKSSSSEVLVATSQTQLFLHLPYSIFGNANLAEGGFFEISLLLPETLEAIFGEASFVEQYRKLHTFLDRQNKIIFRQQTALRVKSRLEQRWRTTLANLYLSNSWRVTSPMRWVMQSIRDLLRLPLATQSYKPRAVTRVLPATAADYKVDVIIPVYAGFEATKRCIDSVLKSSLSNNFDIIVINDCSSDQKIGDYTESLADQGLITLIKNESNLGFVETVNKGMLVHAERDVILLNSDTEVSGNWSERLRNCAYSQKNIATATPFSNSATICSYPRFCEENDLPEGWTQAELDDLAKEVNKGEKIYIPSAVGFCMYIRRECIRSIGLFNAALFKRGYGEENDFCWRAVQIGWSHVLCADTFVYHQSAVSFGAEKKALLERNLRILADVCPGYFDSVDKHIYADPACDFRHKLDVARFQKSKLPLILFATHSIGGGVEKHVRDLAVSLKYKTNVLVLSIDIDGQLTLTFPSTSEGYCETFDPKTDLNKLAEFLKSLGIIRVHIHHSMNFDEELHSLIKTLNVPFDTTIHDFYLVCPRIRLWTASKGYCGQPGEQECNECISDLSNIPSIGEWRKRHQWQIAEASRVIVPSHDTFERIKHYFPDCDNFIVGRHLDDKALELNLPPIVQMVKVGEPLKVGIVGAIGLEKGAIMLDACAQDAYDRKLPVEYHLIGYCSPKPKTIPHSNLIVYGEYEDKDLAKFVEWLGLHVIWFPAEWPETYSYTLSSSLVARMPIVAPNLGAFTERLAGRPWSWICDLPISAQDWNNFFVDIAKNHFATATPPHTFAGVRQEDDFSYATNYLPSGNAVMVR